MSVTSTHCSPEKLIWGSEEAAAWYTEKNEAQPSCSWRCHKFVLGQYTTLLASSHAGTRKCALETINKSSHRITKPLRWVAMGKGKQDRHSSRNKAVGAGMKTADQRAAIPKEELALGIRTDACMMFQQLRLVP